VRDAAQLEYALADAALRERALTDAALLEYALADAALLDAALAVGHLNYSLKGGQSHRARFSSTQRLHRAGRKDLKRIGYCSQIIFDTSPGR